MENAVMDIDPGLWAIAVFFNVFICVGLLLFFYYRRLEVLESYLEGVKSVEWNRSVCGDSYLGRQLRFSNIMLIVLMPNLLFKRGQIPKGADKRIPEKLRRQLKAATVYMALTAVAMVVFYFALPDEPAT
jgi:hypothetical protein